MTGLETASSIASLVTSAVTTFTLIVLIVYTVETQKLRVEAQRQNEHTSMPIVVFQSLVVDKNPGDRNHLVIRNLGPGPAFNIVVTTSPIGQRLASFIHPRTLAPGQSESVTISGLIVDDPNSNTVRINRNIIRTDDLIKCLQKASTVGFTNGVITYASATGKSYQTKFTVDHTADADSLVIFEGMIAM